MVSLDSGKSRVSKFLSIALAAALILQPLPGEDFLFADEEGKPIKGPQPQSQRPKLPEEPTVGGGSSTAAGVLPTNPSIVPDTSNTSNAGMICYTKDGERIPSGEGEKDPGENEDKDSRIIVQETPPPGPTPSPQPTPIFQAPPIIVAQAPGGGGNAVPQAAPRPQQKIVSSKTPKPAPLGLSMKIEGKQTPGNFTIYYQESINKDGSRTVSRVTLYFGKNQEIVELNRPGSHRYEKLAADTLKGLTVIDSQGSPVPVRSAEVKYDDQNRVTQLILKGPEGRIFIVTFDNEGKQTGIRETVENFDNLLSDLRIDRYRIPGNDPHETVPDYWGKRAEGLLKELEELLNSAGEVARAEAVRRFGGFFTQQNIIDYSYMELEAYLNNAMILDTHLDRRDVGRVRAILERIARSYELAGDESAARRFRLAAERAEDVIPYLNAQLEKRKK